MTVRDSIVPSSCHSCESRNLKVYSNICVWASGSLKRSRHRAGRERVSQGRRFIYQRHSYPAFLVGEESITIKDRCFATALNGGYWVNKNCKAIHHYHCQSLIRFLVRPGMTVRGSIVPSSCHSCESRNLKVYSNICFWYQVPWKDPGIKPGGRKGGSERNWSINVTQSLLLAGRLLNSSKSQSDSSLSLAEHYKIPGQARNDGEGFYCPQ